jgi:hypothetical protein
MEHPMSKFKIEFKRDVNGNKYVSIKINGNRAFPIQTLRNLPITHKNDFNSINSLNFCSIKEEIVNYILKFGTAKQKKIVNEI